MAQERQQKRSGTEETTQQCSTTDCTRSISRHPSENRAEIGRYRIAPPRIASSEPYLLLLVDKRVAPRLRHVHVLNPSHSRHVPLGFCAVLCTHAPGPQQPPSPTSPNTAQKRNPSRHKYVVSDKRIRGDTYFRTFCPVFLCVLCWNISQSLRVTTFTSSSGLWQRILHS